MVRMGKQRGWGLCGSCCMHNTHISIQLSQSPHSMAQKIQEFDYLIKIVLIGDSSVGKSNLALRYAGKPFTLQSKPTIGVEFCSRTQKIDNKVVKAQVWDTAGQERFRAITHAYYKGAHGAIIVYDVTRMGTYQNVDKWLKQLREHSTFDSMPVLLIGNKTDLESQRMVKSDQGKNYAQQNGLSFAQMTAKEEDVVITVFDQFVSQVYQEGKKKKIWVQNKMKQSSSETPLENGKGKDKGKDKDKDKEKKFSLLQSIKTLDKQRCCV